MIDWDANLVTLKSKDGEQIVFDDADLIIGADGVFFWLLLLGTSIFLT